MNKIFLHGRLTRKPEIKAVGDGNELCSFTVASDRYAGKDKGKVSDFFDCDAWGAKAALVNKCFDAGDGICVIGEMQSRKFEDKDTGKKRTAWSIRVEDVEFAEKRKGGSTDEPGADVSDAELPF